MKLVVALVLVLIPYADAWAQDPAKTDSDK
jgi:hypothetical protein